VGKSYRAKDKANDHEKGEKNENTHIRTDGIRSGVCASCGGPRPRTRSGVDDHGLERRNECRGCRCFRGKEKIRAWWEGLYAQNGASTVSNCQVDGETVTCLLNYTDDGLKALGLDSIDNDFVVTVQDGKIQTYTATMTDESLAALMAAMPPQAMPETGGNAFPFYAMVAALGGLAVAGGLGMRVFVFRQRWHAQ
jgi:hypothetical protein